MKLAALSVLGASLMSGPAATEVITPTLAAVLDRARADCAAIDSGVMHAPDDSVQEVDLTGDGRGRVLDYSRIDCSSAASLFCGTGGCAVALIVGAHVTERLARSWQVFVLHDMPVVVLDVHGALCGGINPTPCFEALAWDEDSGRFTSIAAHAE